jgi:hypothetical protein
VSSANTTHGSGWIVQAQPTPVGRATASRIPPTAVGGLFKPSLKREAPASLVFVLSIPLDRARGEKEGKAGIQVYSLVGRT